MGGGDSGPSGSTASGPLSPDFVSALAKRLTVDLKNDAAAKALARKEGLDIVGITWDDNARTKNSCWGPCITDMSVTVQGSIMPVIRYPNFEDKTWDVPIDRIKIPVGNENLSPGALAPSLPSVTLREFLVNAPKYTGLKRSLYAPNIDYNVLMSTQTAFLPLAEGCDAKTEFQVALYNYQAQPDDPAVLAILVTAHGSSAQIVDKKVDMDGSSVTLGHKLWHNSGGTRCRFIGERLSDNRRGRAVPVAGPLAAKEAAHNAVIIIQVPLKQKRAVGSAPPIKPGVQTDAPGSSFVFGESSSSVNVEPAIISVGPPAGDFPSLEGRDYERNENFPVRYTVQWYKSTSNGKVDAQVLKEIRERMEATRNKLGVAFSSLVVGRTTEPQTANIPSPCTAASAAASAGPSPAGSSTAHSPATSSGSAASSASVSAPPNSGPGHVNRTAPAASANGSVPSASVHSGAVPPDSAHFAAVPSTSWPPTPAVPPAVAPSAAVPSVAAPSAAALSPAGGNTSNAGGYRCDKCNEVISGIRYKCLICSDFDMCDKCEGATLFETHPACHPPLLVKLRPEHEAVLGHVAHLRGRGHVRHAGAKCGLCNEEIVGIRYQCLVCTGLDICERCEAFADHAKEEHAVAKITAKAPTWLGLTSTELTF